MSVTIGIDVGGTKILGGLVDHAGHVLSTVRQATALRDADRVLAQVAEVVATLVAQSAEPVQAVGLSVAGPVDATGSTVLFAPNLGWPQVPVRQILEPAIGLPVLAENDANCAAWGEYRHGAGEGTDDLTVVTVGTGIGGGVIVGGHMLRGAHGAGAEIGHIVVVRDGLQCGCGRRGCWEMYASGSALVNAARSLAEQHRDQATIVLSLGDGTPEGIEGLQVTAAAIQGDPIAIAAFTQVGTWLGIGLGDLTSVLDPAAFVISGGVCEAGDLLLNPARAALAANLTGGERHPVPALRVATLGNEAGLIGAAELARVARHSPRAV